MTTKTLQNKLRPLWGVLAAGCLFGASVACEDLFQPAAERARLDTLVGQAQTQGYSLQVQDGLAQVRSATVNQIRLWTQAPGLSMSLQTTQDVNLSLEISNCIPNSQLQVGNGAPISPRTNASNTGKLCSYDISVAAGQNENIQLIPPVAADNKFAFGVMSDVQRALPEVGDIWKKMNEHSDLRFVVSTGDLTRNGNDELTREFQTRLEDLNAPFYSTVGNHELGSPPEIWHQYFGRTSFSFLDSGVRFTFVDSASATVDPAVYEQLDGWLASQKGAGHVVLTHIPPLDPIGTRSGAFRHRYEAAKLIAKLGDGQVDSLFLGHVHSYYAFSNGGVPVFVSGGGGAIPETLDGIGRHFLRVDVDAAIPRFSVSLVRVDP